MFIANDHAINKILGKPFDQVAMACRDRDQQKTMARLLGGGEWVEDQVTAEGEVYGVRGRNVANLMFNYTLAPVEFELLHYKEGPNWLSEQNAIPFGSWAMSHVAWHVDDTDPFSTKLRNAGFGVAQSVETRDHTNPFLIKEGRTYRYVIHEARHLLGFDLKLIQRIQ